MHAIRNKQLDPLANWLNTTKNGVTETRTFDVTNALLSQQVGNQTTNLNYDLDGNLKNDSKFHYVFDAFQRIVEVKDQSQNLVAKYQMDTSNRRISKTIGTTVHRTVYAGWQIAEEHETVPSGKKFKTTTKVYVYGQYIDEPLVMQITKPNGNQKKFWYLRNQQYSVYVLTNDNGKIVETYHYSAYGELEIKDANGSTLTESAYANTYFYTGRLLDSETNLYYFRNRYYNANQGRFISRDPLGYVDGMSLYRGYFAVNGLDWSGLEIKKCCKRGGGVEYDDTIQGCCRYDASGNLFGSNEGTVYNLSTQCCIKNSFGNGQIADKNEKKTIRVCIRIADLPGGSLGALVGLYHMWLDLGGIEVGLGPNGGGVPGLTNNPSSSLNPFYGTAVNNHAGQAALPNSRCVSINVNKCCIYSNTSLCPTNVSCANENCNQWSYRKVSECGGDTTIIDQLISDVTSSLTIRFTFVWEIFNE